MSDLSQWSESMHPRDADGKFGAGGHAPKVSDEKQKPGLDESEAERAKREGSYSSWLARQQKTAPPLTPDAEKIPLAELDEG